jgi:magnesium transporter
MSKIDPTTLSTTTKLDRRSTLLLQAARQKTGTSEEKSSLIGIEDPGIDTLRGSFGTIGSIIRARSARRMSQNSGRLPSQRRPLGTVMPYDRNPLDVEAQQDALGGLKRHQLYDAPVPRSDLNPSVSINRTTSASRHPVTIKFDTQDVVYKYDVPGSGEKHTTERREVTGSPAPGYPPLPPVPARPEGLPPSSSHRHIDLLGISETVEDPSNNIPNDGNSQLLEVPPSRTKWNNGAQSAPATVHQRFPATTSATTSVHTLFNDKTPSTTSLLSFPSVTESGPSENWEEEAHARRLNEWEVEQEQIQIQIPGREPGREGRDRGKEKGRERPKAGKRYPGASEDDDREESISLWDRSRAEDDDLVSPQDPSPGGIRLVQPKRPDMF